MFYAGGSQMRAKVGAAVCSARRAGTTATLDQLSKYFTICGMPIAPSQYWPMVHGSTPEDVRQDEEGMQIMRMLGRNHGVYDPRLCAGAGKRAASARHGEAENAHQLHPLTSLCLLDG